jgi:hypothetical protein
MDPDPQPTSSYDIADFGVTTARKRMPCFTALMKSVDPLKYGSLASNHPP